MGAYKLEQWPKDVDITCKGHFTIETLRLKNLGIDIIQTTPDNQLRDMALSKILEACFYLAGSALEGTTGE